MTLRESVQDGQARTSDPGARLPVEELAEDFLRPSPQADTPLPVLKVTLSEPPFSSE